MKATKEQMDANAADYADQFNQPEQQQREISDEEAFGLTPEVEPAAEAVADPEAAAAEPVASDDQSAEVATEPASEAELAEPAAAEAAAPADPEQRLKSWEGRLKARQAELDAREAAMGSSSVNDEQASLELDGGDDSGGGDDAGASTGDDGDPAAVLAEDFGADFVEQITKLVKKVAQDCVGGVSATVDQVIADLQNERLQNHFNAIASTHADFMDVVESPEFAAWKAAQPDQGALDEVIERGSARQIIGMLTAFKDTHKGDRYDHDDALDAAEGVRSSGVSLPKEPTDSEDFAKAWNEA